MLQSNSSKMSSAVCLLVLLLGAIAHVRCSLLSAEVLAPLKDCGNSTFQTVACIGSYGSGKTTLLESLYGQDASGVDVEKRQVVLEADAGLFYGENAKRIRNGAQDTIKAFTTSKLVLFNVLLPDLLREGAAGALASLQPAIEKLLLQHSDQAGIKKEDIESLKRKVFVVVRDVPTKDVASVEAAVKSGLNDVWSSVVKPTAYEGSALADVLDVEVTCLPHYSFAASEYEQKVKALKAKIKAAGNTTSLPADTLLQSLKAATITTKSPVVEAPATGELKGAFVGSAAADKCFELFKGLLAGMLVAFEGLDTEFGEHCDSIIEDVLAQYDEMTMAYKSSRAVKRRRVTLTDAILEELQQEYDSKLELLRTATVNKFRKSLSGMRLSPSLAKDLENAVQEADKYYGDVAKGLKCKYASWSDAVARKEVREENRAFATDRIQAARLQGSYNPSSSRRPVGVSFHWLLPKPLGVDARRSIIGKEDKVFFTGNKPHSEPLWFDFCPQSSDSVNAPHESDMEGRGVKFMKSRKLNKLKKKAQKMVYQKVEPKKKD